MCNVVIGFVPLFFRCLELFCNVVSGFVPLFALLWTLNLYAMLSLSCRRPYDCVLVSFAPRAIKCPKCPNIETFVYPTEMSLFSSLSEKAKKTWGIMGRNWWGGDFFCTATVQCKPQWVCSWCSVLITPHSIFNSVLITHHSISNSDVDYSPQYF